ncbi:MAG: hypothetical protein Q9160_005163 [Pyrenula sp. 1 TL-2023]
MKSFYRYFLIPGIENLAGGLPNPSYFPYDTFEAKTAVPDRFKPTPNQPIDPLPAEQKLKDVHLSDGLSASRILVPHDSTAANPLKKIDLNTALQYGTAQGYPPLYTFIRQFTRKHLYPDFQYKDGPEVILTCGSTDGFSKAIEVFTNAWDEQKDWIREKEGLLCEEFAYGNALQAAKPRGLNIVPVKIDDEGMLAKGKGGLEDVLIHWDFNKGKRPHMMYTVTMGQNPTSGLLSIPRRKEIYALCQKYDIIIVEDDPYWYLQYPSANALSTQHHGKPISPNYPGIGHNYNAGRTTSGYEFLDSLVPSYISMDVDGRVIRLDTFSKTVAPGCRLGWITAQPRVVERILRVTETSTQQPSGFVQSMIAELIIGPQSSSDGGKGGAKDGSGWDVGGWVRWLEGLRGNYERRMQTMSSILEEGKYAISHSARDTIASSPTNTDSLDSDSEEPFLHISKTPMYSFTYPMAGMFLWLHLHLSTHPLSHALPLPRLSHAFWVLLTRPPYLSLISPGTVFAPTETIAQEQGWQYFRLCFAAIDEEKLAEKTRSVVSAARAFWEMRNVEEIEEILKDEDEEGSLDVAREMERRREEGVLGMGDMAHFC